MTVADVRRLQIINIDFQNVVFDWIDLERILEKWSLGGWWQKVDWWELDGVGCSMESDTVWICLVLKCNELLLLQ